MCDYRFIQLHFAADWKQLYPAFVNLIIPDDAVKFRDPRINLCREIQSKVIGGGFFGRRPEVASQ